MEDIIGIVGSGQMGTGICQVFAQNGFPVIFYDVDQKALKKALDSIELRLKKALNKNKIPEELLLNTMENIIQASSLDNMNQASLVIEAVTENKEVKIEIFKKLDAILPKTSIIVSNTSSISITEIASKTHRAGNIAGMHFMNPVPVMKLVEGIKGQETSVETFLKIKELTKKIGKVFIESKDSPGFVVNRILMPMINEAIYAVYEGIASEEDIDKAMILGTNTPMGPLELADFIGLDTCLSIMEVIYKGLGEDKYRPCPLLVKYVKDGRIGKKNGKGFFTY